MYKEQIKSLFPSCNYLPNFAAVLIRSRVNFTSTKTKYNLLLTSLTLILI